MDLFNIYTNPINKTGLVVDDDYFEIPDYNYEWFRYYINNLFK